jgi:hypothetical protein
MARGIVFSLLASLMFFFAACETITPPPGLNVDSRFREFYDLQGGETRLGKAISPIFNQDEMQYQITENTILIYIPTAPAGEQFNFLALAQNFINEDNPLPEYENLGLYAIQGHLVYDEFVPMFKRMGGLRFVGRPLTEVRVNLEQSRYEQYFEKMGFYRLFSDPSGTVRLLPYGLIECHRNTNLACNKNFEDAMPQDLLPQPFLTIIARLGETFAGQPLSQVYLAPDNRLEQIYENVVLSISQDNLRLTALRPLPSLVGIQIQPPVEARNEPGLSFSLKANGLGYNVPNAFLQYIAMHGTLELAGEPITELFEINGVRRQCFTNYCLDYDPQAPANLQIRPAALGYDYQSQQGFSTPDLQLHIWELNPVIEPKETQTLGVLVYNTTPSFPVSQLQPILSLRMPGKEPKEFIFPATSESGTSFLEIPAIDTIGLVEYEVCVSWPGKSPICVRESWIIK